MACCSAPVKVPVPVRLVAGVDARLGLRHELRIHGGRGYQGRAGLGQEHKALVERVLQRGAQQQPLCLRTHGRV